MTAVGAPESGVKSPLIGRLLATIHLLCRALGDRRLKRGHRRLLAAVAGHVGKTGTAWPSLKRLATAAELDDETARVMLQELRRWGYVAWRDAPLPGRPLSSTRQFWLIGCQAADCIAGDTASISNRIARDTNSVSRAIHKNKEKKEEGGAQARMRKALVAMGLQQPGGEP